MAIVVSSIHKRHILDQVEANLIGVQRDMVRNATAHAAMAAAQSPSATALAKMFTDCGANYQTRLGWVTAVRADATKRQWLLDAMSAAGWVEQDVIDLVTGLSTVADAMASATLSGYSAITTACNKVIAACPAPPSLWPE